MKFALLFIFAALIGTPSFSQNGSGIFLSIKCGKKIPKQNVVLSGQVVCLAQNPIIFPSEFESVGEVKQANELIFFDLTLSDKAVLMLGQISTNLPNSSIALVVDKDVFSVFPAGELSVNRTFRFEGTMQNQQSFFAVQEKLKALINGETE